MLKKEYLFKGRLKVFALLMTVVLLFSNSFVYSEAGKCTHGGKDYTPDTHTYVKEVKIGCFEGCPHPIYVKGELTLCRVYKYKILRTRYCKECDSVLEQGYYFLGEEHEYNHG